MNKRGRGVKLAGTGNRRQSGGNPMVGMMLASMLPSLLPLAGPLLSNIGNALSGRGKKKRSSRK